MKHTPRRLTSSIRVALLAAAAALLALALPAASSALPSDRAYEMVSPVEKNTADILASGFAAAEGSGVAYGSFGAFGNVEGTSAAAHYFSHRAGDEWILNGTTPPTSPIGGLGDTIPVAYGDDAATVVFQVVGFQNPGDTQNDRNLIRINPDGSRTLISIGAPAEGVFYRSPQANRNASVVTWHVDGTPTFDVTKGVEPPAIRNNIYAGDGEDVWLISVFPDGTPSTSGGTVYGGGIAEDGSRIFWQPRAGDPLSSELFAWNEDGPSTMVSASQRTEPDPRTSYFPKTFQAATPDGNVAFFASAEMLTDDAGEEGSKLYRYDFGTGALTNLTSGIDDPGAGINVIGLTDDAQRVYFAARGALTPGATPDVTHIYLLDGDDLSLVTEMDRVESLTPADVRMAPDGGTLLFQSSTQLTDYDNAGTEQLYRWSVDEPTVRCVSCNPSGEVPSGNVQLAAGHEAGILQNVTPRNLSADGSRVFFTSPDALVPADTNGRLDAYIWEDGPAGGAVDLLSAGTSSSDSIFTDASASGDDAYFVTRSRLVGIDTDIAADIYDARVGGGIAAQNPPPPEIPCEGDDCKPPITDPGDETTPGTGTVDDDANSAKRCRALDRKAERTERKAERRAKQATGAKQKAKRLKRKAKHASGKRAKALNRKANHASHRAKQLRRRSRKANRRASGLERRATRCERRAAR